MQTKIIKSKRKTVSLAINNQAELVIHAPLHLRLKDMNAVIEKHKNWITRHIQAKLIQLKHTPEKKFINGEKFLYLGNEYPLSINPKAKQALEFDNGFSLHEASKYRARDLFINWYKNQAKNILTTRCSVYSALLGVLPESVTISNANTRWGSCKERKLRFSWRLAMAPLWIIDYVAIHELTHILYKNHSRRFWEKMTKIYPSWKTARLWLKNNGYSLKL